MLGDFEDDYGGRHGPRLLAQRLHVDHEVALVGLHERQLLRPGTPQDQVDVAGRALVQAGTPLAHRHQAAVRGERLVGKHGRKVSRGGELDEPRALAEHQRVH